jgi:hypothetical protein
VTEKPKYRKDQVREAFEKHGREAALELGKKLALSPGSVRTWIGIWKRPKQTAKSKPKKPAKPKAAPAEAGDSPAAA